MKKLLLLLLCVPLIGFGQTEYEKIYYENGQLKLEVNYKDGKEEGLWKGYYDNSQLRMEGNYKDGKQEGLWKGYYDNGQLRSEGNYKDGKLDGVLNGIIKMVN